MLNTETTIVGSVITANSIVNTPLMSCNFIALTLLAPGVTTANPSVFMSGERSGGGGRPYVNGNRKEANNWGHSFRGNPRPLIRWNEFGGTIGPLKHDQVFFFADQIPVSRNIVATNLFNSPDLYPPGPSGAVPGATRCGIRGILSLKREGVFCEKSRTVLRV